MSWTEERVEALIALNAQGLSATQIAMQIGGGFSRNAVIGKIHRLGVVNHGRKQKAKTPRAPWRKPRSDTPKFKPTIVPVEPLPSEDTYVVPTAKRAGVEGLEQDQCRWPFGDPQHAEFHFCDRAKAPGFSYCEQHARRAFQAPQPKKKGSEIAPAPAVKVPENVE